MKLITLNTWGGRAGLDGIKTFVQKNKDVDVFCLQEIWQAEDTSLIEVVGLPFVTNLLTQIATSLPEFQFFFRPQYRGIYGLATFVRKEIPVIEEGELFVFKDQGFENPVAVGNHARNIQHLTLRINNGLVTVVNFHGLWNGNGKTDSADRIMQSQKIAQFLNDLKNPYILAGDFNLNPDTESFKILENICPRNLVKDYGVTSTRTSLYPKPGKFADYILTCEHTKTADFKVLPDEVSDHSPLFASFEF
jgi:endonuclease/exonuclease/phosphatase family metal-dependent hydrolase